MSSCSLALLAALALPQQEPKDPRVEDGVVFVPDRCGAKEGAPPAKNVGKLVLLTDLGKSDDWRPLVEKLVKEKKPAAVISYPEGRIAGARRELEKELPEFALVVSRPERLDVNLHFELLEMAAALDDDPFVDFAFGYVTGATLEEALAFVDRFVALQRRKEPLPKKIVDFGPVASGPPQYGGPFTDGIARGWKRWSAYHGPVAEMFERKELLAGAGILHAGGHGMPDGVVDGLSGKQLREGQFDLSPALYFSGPCYCGVTSGWWQGGSGGIEPMRVDPMESFALAAIAQGVSALFAGFDPDRGETCSQELEILFIRGEGLGHATKATYDGVTVARRQPQLSLFRYEQGKPAPQRDLVDTMTGGGACRALFGDPAWAPIPACAEPALDVQRKDGKRSLDLHWSAERADTSYWSLADVYHCDGGWTHRIAFKIEIPVSTARALTGFEVTKLAADGRPLEHRFPTAMIERFAGRAFLHLYLVFPPRGPQNVFFVERDFEAEFSFPK